VVDFTGSNLYLHQPVQQFPLADVWNSLGQDHFTTKVHSDMGIKRCREDFFLIHPGCRYAWLPANAVLDQDYRHHVLPATFDTIPG
jgi:hypothetical protein